MSVNGQTVQDPNLTDVLRRLKSDTLRTLNCVKVGVIDSFDPDKRTAMVQIAFKRVVPDPQNPPNGTKLQSYPVLVDCPVVTIQGGGGALTFPIKQGDECLVLFSDANLDAWFKNGGEAAPFDGRVHDLSDGIVLVGLNSLANALAVAVVAGETALAFDGAKLGLKTGKLTLANETTDLLTLLILFIDTLKTLQVVGNIALTPASIAALEAFKLQFQTLLYTPAP